ncbi:methyltransferase domain-containing protein [Candidatus Pelagibacter ubique]|nr:methyltransferase domain-containing protein [Candidatus Pelagibacter ubique]
MKIIGNPNLKKNQLKNLISNLNIDEKYLINKKEFRNEILENINNNMIILDIGKSMREQYDNINCAEKKTLDINLFENYPDFQLDLSEEIDIERTELNEKFDVIICLAVLEHVYNPFIAIKNLKQMLKKGGVIYGYVPFLYHYHAPEDLYFQDYYRYSKDGLAYLFREFDNLKLYPLRGRFSSSMNILFGSLWKRTFEKFYFNQILDKLTSKNKNFKQTGGFNFIATK